MSNKEFLTLVFMDDANLFTQSISSLINSIHYIERYSFASGLKINMVKTKGKFFNKKKYLESKNLPGITWQNEMNVVKVNHSPRSWVSEQWKDVLAMFKRELNYYKSFTTTFQSKAIISKSLLLSKLNYICYVHVMPPHFKNAVDKLLLKFFIPCNVNSMSDIEF